MLHPEIGSDGFMQIRGDAAELGEWEEGPKMQRTPEYSDWMPSKYGSSMKPYECMVKFKHPGNESIRGPLLINYNYTYCAPC